MAQNARTAPQQKVPRIKLAACGPQQSSTNRRTLDAAAMLVRLGWLLPSTLQQNGPFLSFPCVCPEPVLVKIIMLYINGSNRPFCHLIAQGFQPAIGRASSPSPAGNGFGFPPASPSPLALPPPVSRWFRANSSIPDRQSS
jgi:hypothetical protein